VRRSSDRVQHSSFECSIVSRVQRRSIERSSLGCRVAQEGA
jgi:hypothetical protein